ncbi:hypothetical protein KNW02_08275 [Paracoccus sp. XHP0099]|uniref:Uncharacterized protein n=2 Tax=Paracoccus marinaquae TaxID=2841926 RepID=A0ABS6AHN8_9RHOB|nr:hypothetical protein [Paracoccus marinaquae]
MPDHVVIRLTLRHDYYLPDLPPLRLLAPVGLVVRRIGERLVVIARDGADLPERVTLTLLAQSPDLCRVTQGYDWHRVPVLKLAEGEDQVRFGTRPEDGDEARRMGDWRVVLLDVALAADPPRDIEVHFSAVAAYWAYWLTGRGLRDDIRIVDPHDAAQFDDLGPATLPDGREARVIRSAEPLALRARPTERFALQYEGQFGPVMLVPVLPAAGVNTRKLTGDGADDRLQADIYVTLS